MKLLLHGIVLLPLPCIIAAQVPVVADRTDLNLSVAELECCASAEYLYLDEHCRGAGKEDARKHKKTDNGVNSLSDGIVHQLDLDNFASVIGSSSFTFCLFYDRDDTSAKLQQQRRILRQLAREYSEMKMPSSFFARNLQISFAELDTRQHGYIRKMFSRRGTENGVGEAYFNFYRDYDALYKPWSVIPPNMINSTTFMQLSQDELYTFPTQWNLFHGADFNVLNYIDETSEVDGVPVEDDDYVMIRSWLGVEIREGLHFAMQGVEQPRLPFGESEVGPLPAIQSFLEEEEALAREHAKSISMDTIDWTKADEMAAAKQNSSQRRASFNPDLFLIEADKDGTTFFQFELTDYVDGKYDAEIMKEVTKLTERYLAWADSYENLWSEERKAREDECTNYGFFLQEMNRQVEHMLFSVFDDVDTSQGFPLIRSVDIPGLKDYYQDMLFGYGRSATSLSQYLNEVVYPISQDGKVDGIALFARIREYMSVREQVGSPRERKRYAMYFRTLWIQFHAILAEFQGNLSRHYVMYLETHPEVKHTRYNFEQLDIIDMKDPANFDLLSNYEEFELRYVEQRKPYILSNVGITEPYNYTLDFLAEKCGFVEVTKSVQRSMQLGDSSVKGWGGLKEFELPEELMTKKRYSETDEEGPDRNLNLEQFIALTERFDNIYLHDFNLKEKCSRLFWSQSPYDPPSQQSFRIPSVIGRYDLFQKVPESSYMHEWPSLFVGRKGTNSKLHIDSGSTAFWMFLVSGKKRWIMYDVAERPFLYERLDRSSFIADVLALNSTTNEDDTACIHDYFDATYPLLDRATSESRGYEIVQEAGQLVYIPPGTPHAVENLEDIVGISFNQVPRAGVANHLHNLIHDLRDFGALEIFLRYLMSEESARSSLVDPLDPLYTTLGEYIAQY